MYRKNKLDLEDYYRRRGMETPDKTYIKDKEERKTVSKNRRGHSIDELC